MTWKVLYQKKKEATIVLAKPKAHESKKILRWIVHLLKNQQGATLLDSGSASGNMGQMHLKFGEKLLELYAVCASEQRKMSDESLEHVSFLCSTAANCWEQLGGAATMKFHIMADHLAAQMAWAGNMTWTHNYMDETENSYLQQIGSSVNRKFHNMRFLVKWYMRFLMSLQA